MKTYRNKIFTKRNYECTNIVFCTANSKTEIDISGPENWVECDPGENKLTKLYRVDNATYYGYL